MKNHKQTLKKLYKEEKKLYNQIAESEIFYRFSAVQLMIFLNGGNPTFYLSENTWRVIDHISSLKKLK